MTGSDLDLIVEQYHRALDAFVRGDPAPNKQLFSRLDDVTLANPLGPPARGWSQVENTMERASSQLAEGEPTDSSESPGILAQTWPTSSRSNERVRRSAEPPSRRRYHFG